MEVEILDEKLKQIVLIAYPEGDTGGLRTLFSDAPNSVKSLIQKPPFIRRMGWNLGTANQSKITDDRAVVSENLARIVELHENGLLIFYGGIHSHFLAWIDGTRLH